MIAWNAQKNKLLRARFRDERRLAQLQLFVEEKGRNVTKLCAHNSSAVQNIS
jgi:hypothetical protein